LLGLIPYKLPLGFVRLQCERYAFSALVIAGSLHVGRGKLCGPCARRSEKRKKNPRSIYRPSEGPSGGNLLIKPFIESAPAIEVRKDHAGA